MNFAGYTEIFAVNLCVFIAEHPAIYLRAMLLNVTLKCDMMILHTSNSS